jgi:hypothetical protein
MLQREIAFSQMGGRYCQSYSFQIFMKKSIDSHSQTLPNIKFLFLLLYVTIIAIHCLTFSNMPILYWLRAWDLFFQSFLALLFLSFFNNESLRTKKLQFYSKFFFLMNGFHMKAHSIFRGIRRKKKFNLIEKLIQWMSNAFNSLRMR